MDILRPKSLDSNQLIPYDPIRDSQYVRRYNPYRHLEEIVPEEIRTLPTFPYNEDRTQRWCYRCKVFQNIADFRPNYGSCKHSLKLSIERKRAANYRTNYGFSLEEYNQMFEAQGGRCAVCRRVETNLDPRNGRVKHLSVDHDHKTGEVRGLLCCDCNTALGHLRESAHRTRALLAYINKIHPTKRGNQSISPPSLWD